MQIRPDEPNLLLIALIQKTIEFMSQALENKNDPSRYQLFQYSFADVHWKLCQRKLTYSGGQSYKCSTVVNYDARTTLVL